MKKSIIPIIFVFLSAFMLLAVSGCSRPDTQETAEGEKTDSNATSQPSSTSDTVDIEELRSWYGDPVELTNSDVPETYKADVFGKISIDAEIHVPKDFSFGKLRGNEKRFDDHKKIVDLFLTGPVKEESNGGPAQFYYGSDGSCLSIIHPEDNPDILEYFSGGDSYNNRVEDMEMWGHNSYKKFVEGSNTYFAPEARQFFDETEIPGLPAEDAIRIVAEKADALGIEYDPQPQVFVIDSVGVSEYRENRKEQFPGLTMENTEYTSEDDAYLIFFDLACNGMPICNDGWANYNYEQEAGYVGYGGERLYGVVSRKGLLEFYANPGYTVKEEMETNLKLYNADIVEKVIKKQFNIGLETSKCEFTSFSLKYVCTNGRTDNGEDLIFEPVWACIYNKAENIGGKEDIYTDVLYIKAATGELMKTDSADIIHFIEEKQ